MVERLHRRLKESLMALGNEDRGNWFWRLPMTLLSLRTTVKPDLGASPSDLVYGEGLSVPGQLLPSAAISDEDLLSRQRRTLSHLRMEVERMQPVPTSAHRRPAVHVPEELNACTHVFVLRGGVQPTLTTPYEGPFRVIDRTPEGFRIEFPGRPSDIVALSRLRPAIMAPPDDHMASQEGQQDPADAIPPSPPPPGRRPGLRTRVPDATDRVTRSESARQAAARGDRNNDDEPIPCSSRDVPGSPLPPSPSSPTPHSPPLHFPEPTQGLPTSPNPQSPAEGNDATGGSQGLPVPESEPPTRVAPMTFTSRQQRHFSNQGGPVPTLALNQAGREPGTETSEQGGVPRRRVLSFSKPQPGNFSHRRRRPDVSALNDIIRSHMS